MVVLYLVGLLYTTNFERGLTNLEDRITMLLLPLVILSSPILDRKTLDQVLKMFVLGCTAAVLIFYAVGFPEIYHKFGELFPQDLAFSPHRDFLVNTLKIHPTFMSLYLAYGFFIVFYFLLRKVTWRRTIIGSVFLFLFAFAINLFASRLVIIASCLVLAVWIVSLFSSIYYKVGVVAGLAVLALILTQWFPQTIDRFREIQNTKWESPKEDNLNSINMRLAHWECSLKAIRKNWILGVGSGDGQDHINRCYQERDLAPILHQRDFNAHNQYLETWLAVGLPGLIAMLWLFGYLVGKAQQHRFVLLAVFVTLSGLLCLTDSIFERQKGVAFFFFFSSILVSYLVKDKASSEQTPKKLPESDYLI
ncbi:MAG: O-antigen ligase family protein [Cyclobacteriaceae bacterium]